MKFSVVSNWRGKAACCAFVALAVVALLSDGGRPLDASTLRSCRGGSQENGQWPFDCELESGIILPCVGKVEGDQCITCQVVELKQAKKADDDHPGGYADTTLPGIPPQSCGVQWKGTCKASPLFLKCIKNVGGAQQGSCANHVEVVKQETIPPG